MVSALDSAGSALRAFGTRLNVTADNVANVRTDGFKKGLTVIEEAPEGGVRAKVGRSDTPGPLDPQTGKPLSNVDLAEETVDQIPTDIGYKANTAVMRTEDEMLGSLLDAMG